MAYSRWGDSDWYVFWAADYESPYLEMWFAGGPMTGASFEQLDGISEEKLATLVPGAPADSIPELMGYVHDFCADVRDMRAGGKPSRW